MISIYLYSMLQHVNKLFVCEILKKLNVFVGVSNDLRHRGDADDNDEKTKQ